MDHIWTKYAVDVVEIVLPVTSSVHLAVSTPLVTITLHNHTTRKSGWKVSI
jgi:hypothetical protein